MFPMLHHVIWIKLQPQLLIDMLLMMDHPIQLCYDLGQIELCLEKGSHASDLFSLLLGSLQTTE